MGLLGLLREQLWLLRLLREQLWLLGEQLWLLGEQLWLLGEHRLLRLCEAVGLISIITKDIISIMKS
jgi:hypothetical protein